MVKVLVAWWNIRQRNLTVNILYISIITSMSTANAWLFNKLELTLGTYSRGDLEGLRQWSYTNSADEQNLYNQKTNMYRGWKGTLVDRGAEGTKFWRIGFFSLTCPRLARKRTSQMVALLVAMCWRWTSVTLSPRRHDAVSWDDSTLHHDMPHRKHDVGLSKPTGCLVPCPHECHYEDEGGCQTQLTFYLMVELVYSD
jgi:hypothetical protein